MPTVSPLVAPPPTDLAGRYPGRIVKKGDPNSAVVKALQRRLNQLGCGPVAVDGDFGPATRDAVRGFQARTTDQDNLPLRIDGEVGPLTWAALFGIASVPQEADSTTERLLLAKVVQLAAAEVGVLEAPPHSNRGPQVDDYIRRTGQTPGVFWCMCFVYWCFDEAARTLGVKNPCVKTAGVLDHWNRAGRQGVRRIGAAEARQNPALVRPGQVFCIRTHRPGAPHAGHTGLVVSVLGGKLTTIEGNSNAGGSDNGGGVHRLTFRKVNSINVGFIDYDC